MRFLVALLVVSALAMRAEGRLNYKTPPLLQVHRTNVSMCEKIHPEDLPEECFCREKPPLGLVVECLKVFNSTFFNDTIGMKIDLDPCNEEGSSVSIDVTERNNNIDYPIERIKAGEEEDFPIPGLAIIVPGFGHVGVDVAVYISGNPSTLILKIGLNACAALAQSTVCASSIPGLNMILPWYVLSGVYSFGDICSPWIKTTSDLAVAALE
mmetsp:Transcript_8693/g.11515  ORF Transcript_8693/g.11515 Transcript_8693/m.11515 type:complete len:211 (-) Transcript_8693:270-902(-)